MPELSPSPQAPALPPEPPPLARYVRRNILSMALSVVLLIVGVALLSVQFRVEIHAFAEWVFETVGIVGLAFLLFVCECVISPLPPDVILLLLSKSKHSEHWALLVPLLGLISAIGGWVGYFLGRKLARTEWGRLFFGRFGPARTRRYSAALVHRYGTWAVALAAVTPLPFSVMCWTAGILEMRFARVAWACLLRIPRFIIFYLLIAHAEALARPFL